MMQSKVSCHWWQIALKVLASLCNSRQQNKQKPRSSAWSLLYLSYYRKLSCEIVCIMMYHDVSCSHFQQLVQFDSTTKARALLVHACMAGRCIPYIGDGKALAWILTTQAHIYIYIHHVKFDFREGCWTRATVLVANSAGRYRLLFKAGRLTQMPMRDKRFPPSWVLASLRLSQVFRTGSCFCRHPLQAHVSQQPLAPSCKTLAPAPSMILQVLFAGQWINAHRELRRHRHQVDKHATSEHVIKLKYLENLRKNEYSRVELPGVRNLMLRERTWRHVVHW